jgi:HdeA/HdeB family
MPPAPIFLNKSIFLSATVPALLYSSAKLVEVIVNARLLLTSALLVFVQIPAQAQVTVDVAKVTCDELFKEELQWTSGEIILWLSGYYHGEGHNTIIQPGALKRDEEKLNQYCYGHGDATVMDAVKNMGLGK